MLNVLYLYDEIENDSILSKINKCYFKISKQKVSSTIKVNVQSKSEIIIMDDKSYDKLTPKGFNLLKIVNHNPKIVIVSDNKDNKLAVDLILDSSLDMDTFTNKLLELLPVEHKYFCDDLLICHQENIKLDKNTNLVYKDNQLVYLSKAELKLLRLFLENKGQELERNKIKSIICSENNKREADSLRIVDVYVKNLRRKADIDCIKSIKGVGYEWRLKKQH